MIRLIFFGLLACSSPAVSFSQTKVIPDPDSIKPNDIYNNFKVHQKAYPPSGTYRSETAGKLVNNSAGTLQVFKFSYTQMTGMADSLFKEKQYYQASQIYLVTFKRNEDRGQVLHRYRAAISLASIADSNGAFEQLYRIAEKGNYYNYHEIGREISFEALRKDIRWPKLMELIKENARRIEKTLHAEIYLQQQ